MQVKRMTPKQGEVFSFKHTLNPQLTSGKKFVCIKVAPGEVVETIKINNKEVNKIAKGNIITFYDITNKERIYKVRLKESILFNFYNSQQETFVNGKEVKIITISKQKYFVTKQKVPVRVLGKVEEVNLVFTNCTNMMAELRIQKAIRFLQTCNSLKEVNDFCEDMNNVYKNVILAEKIDNQQLNILKKEEWLKKCTSKFNRWIDHYQTLSTIMAKNHIDRIKTKTDDKYKAIGSEGVHKGKEALEKMQSSLYKNKQKYLNNQTKITKEVEELFTDNKTYFKNA